MNQTGYNIKNDEIIIDLKELFWRLLGQWKAIIIFSLIVMLAFSGLMYAKSGNGEAASDIPEQAVETQEDILASLTPGDQEIVLGALSEKKSLDTLRDYVRTSIFMNMDPNRVNTFVMSFMTSAEEDICRQLSAAYINEFASSEVAETVKNAWGTEYSIEQVKELIVAKSDIPLDSEAKFNGNIVNVLVYLPEGTDSDKTAEAITSCLSVINKKLSTSIGDHEIKVLGTDTRVASDLDFSKTKSEVLTQLYNMTYQMAYITNMMTAEQKDAYNKLIEYENNYDEDNDEGIAEPVETPMFSKRNMVIGFILGCILYCGVYLLYFMFSGKVFSPLNIRKIFGIRDLGEWYSADCSGLLGSLFSSKLILKHRHKGHLNMDNETDKVCSSILKAFDNVEDKSLLLVTNKGSGESCSRMISALQSKINEAGINVTVTSVDNKEGITLNEGVLDKHSMMAIIVSEAVTAVKDIRDICEKSYYCDVPIVGAVYTGN